MRIRKDAKIWSWQLFYSSSKNIRWYFQFILRIYPVTMLSDKLCTNSNYTHSDSFSYLDISHLIKNLPSVWYCCLNWIGATTKLLYLFSSLFGKLLQRIARWLALLVLVSFYFFSKFSPLFSQSYNYCGLTPLSNELRQERSRSCITPGNFISKSAISIRQVSDNGKHKCSINICIFKDLLQVVC